ncbi:MAG: hypothetical protein AAF902_23050, partial [Chloroflexota bacterium]
MAKKILALFSTVALAAVSLWFFTGVYAAPNDIDLKIRFSEESISAEQSKFFANIEVERTEESGTPPFKLEFLMPKGVSLAGSIEDIAIENGKGDISLEDGTLQVSGLDLGSGRLRMQVPLQFDACPNSEESCKLTGTVRLTDGKDQSTQQSTSLVVDGIVGILADDLVVNITSPGDLPANSYKVEMIYERTPGSGTDDMSLGYTGIPFKNISNLEVKRADADGFEAKENEDGNGFRADGQIAEGGRVSISFNFLMPACANGASECKYTHNAYAGDSKGNVVVWEEQFTYEAETGSVGELDLNIIMIGELKEREIEMTLSRDGGEGQIEGEVRLIIPETPIPVMPSLTEHYK